MTAFHSKTCSWNVWLLPYLHNSAWQYSFLLNHSVLMKAADSLSIQVFPDFVQPWQSAVGSVCCCDRWCWYVSLGGNSSCSYLGFILTESPESVLGNKGGRVLCGVHLGQVQFTVNTQAGVPQRSPMSICEWVRRLLSQFCWRVQKYLVMKLKSKTNLIIGWFWLSKFNPQHSCSLN